MERILIKRVKENDVLYNAKSTYYRDSDVRQQTWQKIGNELHLRADEARSIWDKLRRCFINARNRRRIREHESGITIHPWKYERDMAFLWPFVGRNRKTVDFTRPDGSTSYDNADSETEDKDSVFENIPNDSSDNVRPKIEEVPGYNTPEPLLYNGMDDIHTPIVETMLGDRKEYQNYDDTAEGMDYKRKPMMPENSPLEMDESDLFYMSMSKMAKTLPGLERAKVKLAVSNAVLQALIAYHENANPS